MKKNIKSKIFTGLILFSWFLGVFSTPLMVSITNDVAGLRMSSSDNFYAISESDVTTRWIMQGSEISAVEDFHDDINTNYWNLVGVSENKIITSLTPQSDTFGTSLFPTTTYGSSTFMHIVNKTTPQYDYTFLKYDISNDYLHLNVSGDTYVKVYSYSSESTSSTVYVYSTSSFVESTLNYNNCPDAIDLLDSTSVGSGIGWRYYSLGNDPSIIYYRLETSIGELQLLNTKESYYVPKFIFNLSKNYFGSGYMYMQTNSTELIGLKSQDYGSHYNLSSGDYFEIDFQTSSDSQINLILLKNGVANKTLTISQSGNTNFNRHTVQISVDENVEFDQLKISSTFEDEDNVKVYDIKTYKYTITGDYADFYVGSKRTHSVNLTSDTYNLRIFEEEIKKVDTNITIGISDYFYVYTPTPNQQCRLSLFSPDHIYLPLTDYHIDINRSLNEEYNQFALLDNVFNVDMETYVYIDVYDRFNTLIDSFTRLASEYIDLELDVFQLQIKNLMEQKTTIDINGSYVYELLSGNTIEFMLASSYYEIGYYDDDNDDQQFSIYLDSNQAYELNRSKICFLSYTDQQANHLPFDNYKTYINGTLIYENVFYEDAGDHVNITITDRYDYEVYQDVYIVTSGDNYIPITLTMYSFKIMNQQELFNHINITRDPNDSGYYWSEWIAPNEIVEFKLFAGDYIFNLTDNENGYSSYEYSLNGDDVLLISSDNIISNVIYNIENINTTIGNQITNVQIDLTNQNSEINNSIINIEINLSNVNSSLGDLLVNIGLNITNIENNVSTLYVFTENSFVNLNNSIDTYFISIDNQIISINETISNLVIGVDNSIYLINGTVSTLISSLSNDLLLMNVSIDTALFNLNTTIEQIGSNITSNYILLNNSITLTNNNINTTAIGIINNLLLVNNTISDLITQVYTSVYLINNSIYTAVVDLGTDLSLMNNTITSDLSIVLEMNEYLTEMYQTTMFNSLLNFTNIAGNVSLFEELVGVWSFINDYRDTSAIVELRYNGIIEELLVSAQNTIDQYLPATNVDYRIWSIANEEYLTEWEPLPDTKTVSFGFYQEEIPIIPPPIQIDAFPIVIAIIFLSLLIGIIVIVFLRAKYGRY